MPLAQYHAGQIKVQEEANSRTVADHLAHWTGPAAEFALEADLLLLSTLNREGGLAIHVLSGKPPLIEVVGDNRIAFSQRPELEDVPEGKTGGLAINLAAARRVRINGTVERVGGVTEMQLSESFTLCRKYIAPSVNLGDATTTHPVSRRTVGFNDARLQGVLHRAETAFLATVSPDGWPDVAHRGGPAGFIKVDPLTGVLNWPEYVGDGVFKSVGNARVTGHVTMLVVDFETGDAVELVGRGDYVNERVLRKERRDPLVQFKTSYPLQGRMDCQIERVNWVTGMFGMRQRIPKALKVTSSSTPDDQAPQ